MAKGKKELTKLEEERRNPEYRSADGKKGKNKSGEKGKLPAQAGGQKGRAAMADYKVKEMGRRA